MKRRLFALVPVLALLAACATSPVTAPVSVADSVVHTVDRVLMPPAR